MNNTKFETGDSKRDMIYCSNKPIRTFDKHKDYMKYIQYIYVYDLLMRSKG